MVFIHRLFLPESEAARLPHVLLYKKTSRRGIDGGYSIYDYDSGAYKEATPRSDGGFSIYDYDSGAYSEVLPKSDGSFSVYDYSSGDYSEIKPRSDGSFDVWDYGIDDDDLSDVDEDN